MARRRITREEYEARHTPTISPEAAAMAAWSGSPKVKRRSSWDRAATRQEMTDLIKANDWSGAKPKHFVELYVKLHTDVYGVEPLDLASSKTRLAAASLASKALKTFFEGDADEMADFMRWVWLRQEWEEKRRRAGATSNDFRVTWRYQWSPRLVTDFRRARMTEKGRT